MRWITGFVKWTASAAFLVAVQLAWSHGPLEAYAIARLDGAELVPLPLPPIETCCPAGFTNANYLRVAPGDTADDVRARLGEPLQIFWALDEGFLPPSVWFEARGGSWVASYASKIEVAEGTPMSTLATLRNRVVVEVWTYSRSCAPDSSRRVRDVTFEGGRVVHRSSGVYHD
jgi:hypothetical protein